MSGPIGARAARFASIAVAVVVLSLAMAWALPAFAEDIVIDTEATVQKGACEYCHANIAETDNYSQEIIFSHGLHLVIPCESCHSKFPHGRAGTAVPTMEVCFRCHNLRHGPMGILATGKCEDCHITPRDRLRPAFHTEDWEFEPHVKPGEDELQTKCMMCHTQRECDDCHVQQGVDWKPEKPFIYDPGEGCNACHGNALLTKASADGPKSFQVTGIDTSVHQKLTCIQCHADFRYDDQPNATPLWDVNAGKSCQNCKDHSKTSNEYMQSIHGTELAKGNYETATCSSCHGGHNIQDLDVAANRAQLHGDAYRICARCHKEQFDSYDDYYHGRPYKEGNGDAPACWDCHGSHEVLNSSDPKSTMNAKNRAETCGGSLVGDEMACHTGSAEVFGTEAGDLIHQKRSVREGNPLGKLIAAIKAVFS